MKLLGKDGILYRALAIVIAVLAPIVAVIYMLVEWVINLVWKRGLGKIKNIMIITAILGLLWCIIVVNELDTRTYELKNLYEELSVKHNRLVRATELLYKSQGYKE